MMKSRALLALFFSVVTAAFAAAPVHLLQRPAMNKTEIVFSYAGDLWTVSRQGGVASRLTSGSGVETEIAFSPDGKTAGVHRRVRRQHRRLHRPDHRRRAEAHHVSSRCRSRRRLDARRQAHPLPLHARRSLSRYTQLYHRRGRGRPSRSAAAADGRCMGSYSPDGKRMVYAPIDGGQFATGFTNFVAWKRYRGGRASYLWIVNLADLTTQKIPRTDSNDIYPMWIGDKIYFLSDRNGPMTLFRYDPQSKKVTS